jgi:hypothetical protein
LDVCANAQIASELRPRRLLLRQMQSPCPLVRFVYIDTYPHHHKVEISVGFAYRSFNNLLSRRRLYEYESRRPPPKITHFQRRDLENCESQALRFFVTAGIRHDVFAVEHDCLISTCSDVLVLVRIWAIPANVPAQRSVALSHRHAERPSRNACIGTGGGSQPMSAKTTLTCIMRRDFGRSNPCRRLTNLLQRLLDQTDVTRIVSSGVSSGPVEGLRVKSWLLPRNRREPFSPKP